MLDERPSGPSDDQLEDLGLSRDDLGAFDVNADADGTETGSEADVGDQESTLEQPPAPVTEKEAAPAGEKPADQQQPPRGPAERPPESPTPHAKAELDRHKPRSSAPERPPQAPGDKPPAAAPSAPTTEPTAVVPWTPTADGRRLAIEGAVVQADGSVSIPKASLPALSRHLADRNVWRSEREGMLERIESLNPEHNEHVILSKLLAEDMTKAEAEGGDEGLWRWVQDFKAALPRLKAEARAEAVDRENKRLRGRTDAIDQQSEWERLEPILQDGLAQELDAYLELAQFQGLKPQRARLAARFWNELRGEVLKRSDGDYPEHGLRKGEPFIVRPVIERELLYAADLLKQQTTAAKGSEQRTEAERRNAAALGGDPPVPPAAPVGGRPLPGESAGDGRPKDRQAWLDRMDEIADSPVR